MNVNFDKLGLYISCINSNEIELNIKDIMKIIGLKDIYKGFFDDLKNYLYKNNLIFFPNLEDNIITIYKK